MSDRWYRISLSLAAKCRVGFALAVLLIISAGLFIPYRWMDKLVEQGKRELAQTEVEYLLLRHFRNVDELDDTSGIPPLTAPYKSVSSRPVTRWFALSQLQSTESAKGTVDFSDDSINGDDFLRKGIKRFLEDSETDEIFELQSSSLVSDSSPVVSAASEEDGSTGYLAVSPGRRPARFLYAVRAGAGCLIAGCHGTAAVEISSASAVSMEAARTFSENQLVGVISVLMPAGQTSTTLLFNRIFIIAGGLLSCVCAVVTFYLITQRFILQPVRSLRVAAEKVTLDFADTQDPSESDRHAWQEALNITAEIKTGDEYEKMAQAFGQMLSRLKIAHDRLRETNRALDLQLGELEARNVALFESNKLKSEFLANVSHELRTPLNAIIGFTEILKEQAEERCDTKTLRYSSNVLEAGRGLLKIINELLDLASIEAGKIQVHWEKCSIQSIVEALLNFTRPLFEGKNIAVNVNIPKELPLIETDPARLQQILFNLLDNAIKFTPENGRVDIDVSMFEHDSDFVRIVVSDTGPGVVPEDREKIFDKFRQLDGSVTRAHSGTGLGLAIVKELTQILHASIVVSENTPHGAVFTLTLPANPPALS